MVFNAVKAFGCKHQWTSVKGTFICTNCAHIRSELPIKDGQPFRLYFFPVQESAPFIDNEQAEILDNAK